MSERGFITREFEGVELLQIPSFCETNAVNHGFSTRIGGVSRGPFESLNLGYIHDERALVDENYARFYRAAGIVSPHKVRTLQQHGATVFEVTAQHGANDWQQGIEGGIDALICNTPGVAILSFHADCTPLFFLDPIRKAIGLAHAGWRGSALEIAKKTVAAMAERFGSNPSDLLCGIGPAIGPCCYEVDAPVIEAFSRILPKGEVLRPARPGHSMLDLPRANRLQLLEAGVEARNITQSGVCTHCAHERFFSHRRLGARRGVAASVLELRP